MPKALCQFKTEKQLLAVEGGCGAFSCENLKFQLLAGPHSKPVSKHLKELCEFEAGLGYTASSMPAWVFKIKIIATRGSLALHPNTGLKQQNRVERSVGSTQTPLHNK